jgi:hypothetical protein
MNMLVLPRACAHALAQFRFCCYGAWVRDNDARVAALVSTLAAIELPTGPAQAQHHQARLSTPARLSVVLGRR